MEDSARLFFSSNKSKEKKFIVESKCKLYIETKQLRHTDMQKEKCKNN